MPDVEKSKYFYRGRSQNWKTSKFAILTPCARVQAYRHQTHFIMSKTVSEVRADATEVPTCRHKSSSTNGLAATGPQSGSNILKTNFGKQFFASTMTRKIRWIHWWNPFSNPFTITEDIYIFVTAMSALSNTPQPGVYNYARGRYFALGYALCSYF